MGVVDISDAGDLSPPLGVEAMLRDIEGVENVFSIPLVCASGRTSSLDIVSMARIVYLRKNGHETRGYSRIRRYR